MNNHPFRLLFVLGVIAVSGQQSLAGDVTLDSTATGGGVNTDTFKSGNAIIVKGTAPAGTNIFVYWSDNPTGSKTATADASGNWEV